MADEVSDWAKWQHAENVLGGYRARVFQGDVGYDPPASSGSAREVSYRWGWIVASFDLAAKWLHGVGLKCRVRGEEDTSSMELIGGTDYVDSKPFGMFTGRTFMLGFNDEGHIVARVSGPGQLSTDKTFELDTIDTLDVVMDAAADFVMVTLGVH